MNTVTIRYDYPDRALTAISVAQSVLAGYAGMIPDGENIEIHLSPNMVAGSIEWETGEHMFIVRHDGAKDARDD
jgi:hypothetical protein